ncbi:hypothetical protein J5307_08265 [Riemerella anatipestifer]|nr:hypothetical protein [Riemerella anatipestifer]MBT0556752.1 hypothetical protein [Riemerella anatipestifer]MBT0560697.1 hypothetical protein [Riemerella anatipestifer]MSN87084.1 hypothetical protein [Riemerella anatipestifer]NAV17090.1 hypothetical protein [Riemerella anatipestifer]
MDSNLVQILVSVIIAILLLLYIKDKKRYMKGKEYDPTDEAEIVKSYMRIALCVLSVIISVFRLLA